MLKQDMGHNYRMRGKYYSLGIVNLWIFNPQAAKAESLNRLKPMIDFWTKVRSNMILLNGRKGSGNEWSNSAPIFLCSYYYSLQIFIQVIKTLLSQCENISRNKELQNKTHDVGVTQWVRQHLRRTWIIHVLLRCCLIHWATPELCVFSYE